MALLLLYLVIDPERWFFLDTFTLSCGRLEVLKG